VPLKSITLVLLRIFPMNFEVLLILASLSPIGPNPRVKYPTLRLGILQATISHIFENFT
jgi:hypothetical protein